MHSGLPHRPGYAVVPQLEPGAFRGLSEELCRPSERDRHAYYEKQDHREEQQRVGARPGP